MCKKSRVFIEIIILVIVIATIVFASITMSFNDTEYVVTVTEKERIVSDDSSRYLIFAEDVQGNVIVFENTDSLLRGKFDSSNMQGEIKEGETYVFTVIGYRVPFLSMYQNIIEIECLDGGANK